jgi:hypothetical protein
MYKRILTALTVAVVGLAIAVPVATARLSLQTGGSQEVQETWTWPVRSQGSVPSQATTREKLAEIGLWAVPARHATPRASINSKLEEIGAWAVPSQTSKPKPAPAATGDGNGFDWNVGIASAVVLGVMVVGTGLVVTTRHRHGPLAH